MLQTHVMKLARAVHSFCMLQEGRPIGYASAQLDVIAAVEESRRQADVTIFEPTGAVVFAVMH